MDEAKVSFDLEGLSDVEVLVVQHLGLRITSDIEIRRTSFEVRVDLWESIKQALSSTPSPPLNLHINGSLIGIKTHLIRDYERSGAIIGLGKFEVDDICQEVGIPAYQQLGYGQLQWQIAGSWQQVEDALMLAQAKGALKVLQIHSKVSGSIPTEPIRL